MPKIPEFSRSIGPLAHEVVEVAKTIPAFKLPEHPWKNLPTNLRLIGIGSEKAAYLVPELQLVVSIHLDPKPRSQAFAEFYLLRMMWLLFPDNFPQPYAVFSILNTPSDPMAVTVQLSQFVKTRPNNPRVPVRSLHHLDLEADNEFGFVLDSIELDRMPVVIDSNPTNFGVTEAGAGQKTSVVYFDTVYGFRLPDHGDDLFLRKQQQFYPETTLQQAIKSYWRAVFHSRQPGYKELDIDFFR